MGEPEREEQDLKGQLVGQCEHLHFVCVCVCASLCVWLCTSVGLGGGYLQRSGQVSVYPRVCLVCACEHLCCQQEPATAVVLMTYVGDFLRSCCEPHNNYYPLKVNSPLCPERGVKVFGALRIHD